MVLHFNPISPRPGEFLELNVSDPEQMLDKFLQTCTVRQVRMLREIARSKLEEARLQ